MPPDHIKHAATEYPVVDLILQRWSPRAFAATPVGDGDLRTIFTAGAWAASSYNEQPWRFVLGRQGDDIWNNIFVALVPANQAWARTAPVLFAAFAKTTFSQNGQPNRVAGHDVGAASANIALQATALGLHAHGMGGFDGGKLRQATGAPEDFEPVACWALGTLGDPQALDESYRKAESEPRQRKPLSEIVFARWGQGAL